MRRKRVVKKWLRFGDGAVTRPSTASWVTEACGTPLFSYDADRCRGCREGWWHPRNYPVSLEPWLEQPCPTVALAHTTAQAEAEYADLYIGHFTERRAA